MACDPSGNEPFFILSHPRQTGRPTDSILRQNNNIYVHLKSEVFQSLHTLRLESLKLVFQSLHTLRLESLKLVFQTLKQTIVLASQLGHLLCARHKSFFQQLFTDRLFHNSLYHNSSGSEVYIH